jgi:hypothetical protein
MSLGTNHQRNIAFAAKQAALRDKLQAGDYVVGNSSGRKGREKMLINRIRRIIKGKESEQ